MRDNDGNLKFELSPHELQPLFPHVQRGALLDLITGVRRPGTVVADSALEMKIGLSFTEKREIVLRGPHKLAGYVPLTAHLRPLEEVGTVELTVPPDSYLEVVQLDEHHLAVVWAGRA